MPAARVEEQARAAGICYRTLKEAKKALRVESHRVKRHGQEYWEWTFPRSGLPPAAAATAAVPAGSVMPTVRKLLDRPGGSWLESG